MKNLKVKGSLKMEDGREFTRLVGGFGEDKTVITTKQIGELMGSNNRTVNQTINRNISSFDKDVHIVDLKSDVTQSDSEIFSLNE